MATESSVPKQSSVEIHPVKVPGFQGDVSNHELGRRVSGLRLDQFIEFMWGILDGYVESAEHSAGEEYRGVFDSISKSFVLYLRLSILCLTRRYRSERSSLERGFSANPESGMVDRNES